MTPDEIEEIARQTAEALRSDPAWWEIFAAFGPVAVLAGAVATPWIGLASVKRQRLNMEKQSSDNQDALKERRRAITGPNGGSGLSGRWMRQCPAAPSGRTLGSIC